MKCRMNESRGKDPITGRQSGACDGDEEMVVQNHCQRLGNGRWEAISTVQTDAADDREAISKELDVSQEQNLMRKRPEQKR